MLHKSNGRQTEDCWNYKALEAAEKIKLIKESKSCWSCLKGGHNSSECRYKRKRGINSCDKYHHTSLHQAHLNGVTLHASVLKSREQKGVSDVCLLLIMKIFSGERELSVLFDSGASISLITFKMANSLGLKGSKTNLTVVKIGGEVEKIASFKAHYH